MATTAIIAMGLSRKKNLKLSDHIKIRYMVCDFDGSKRNAGRLLKKDYKTRKEVENLINVSSIQSVDSAKPGPLSEENPPMIGTLEDAYHELYFQEGVHIYVFMPDGRWMYMNFDTDDDWVAL